MAAGPALCKKGTHLRQVFRGAVPYRSPSGLTSRFFGSSGPANRGVGRFSTSSRSKLPQKEALFAQNLGRRGRRAIAEGIPKPREMAAMLLARRLRDKCPFVTFVTPLRHARASRSLGKWPRCCLRGVCVTNDLSLRHAHGGHAGGIGGRCNDRLSPPCPFVTRTSVLGGALDGAVSRLLYLF